MPPKSRKRKRVEEKTNWFDIPFEMREMVIDQMDPRTRCKFAQCSKLCRKEVKGSRNYLCSIKIRDYLIVKELYIGHSTSEYHYCLRFFDSDAPEEPPTSMVTYTRVLPKSEDPDNGLKWAKMEYGTAENVRNEFINGIIEKYNKSIKKLEISIKTDGVSNPLANINLKCLENLEYINREPICLIGDVIELGIVSLEQVYGADYVSLPATKFTFDDIKKFKASFCAVNIDDFNEESFAKFLEMVKNRELLGNGKRFIFSTGKDSLTDYQKMTENLDVFEYLGDDTMGFFKFHLNSQEEGKRETAHVTYVSGTYIINFEYE